MRKINRLIAFVVLVAVSQFINALEVNRMIAKCTAECGGGASVTCDGSSCSAKDYAGCTYTEDGVKKEKNCPIAGMAPEESVLIDGYPSGLEKNVELEIIRHEVNELGLHRDLNGGIIDTYKMPASCVVNCGSYSYTCNGSNDCFSIDGTLCADVHSNGMTVKSCANGVYWEEI